MHDLDVLVKRALVGAGVVADLAHERPVSAVNILEVSVKMNLLSKSGSAGGASVRTILDPTRLCRTATRTCTRNKLSWNNC